MKTEELIDQLDKNSLVQVTEYLKEWTVEVSKERLKPLLTYFKDASYRVLMDLTAVDYVKDIKRTKIIYLLHNPINFQRVSIILYVLRGDKIPSVTDLFPGANWYERELFDMFGILFLEHPDLKRILMPDDWTGHPMLKDYALTEVPVEFKHGVKPKVPSEIIPDVKLRIIHHD